MLAKANLYPFAIGIDTESEIAGPTRNPFDITRTTYGTSSGNAAAGAASFSLINFGTDTTGSSLSPASATNLFAVRPPLNFYSMTGLVGLNPDQDTICPLTKSMRDTADIFQVLVGDSFSVNTERVSLQDVRIALLYNLTYQDWQWNVQNETYVYKIDVEVRKSIDLFVANVVFLGAQVETSYADLLGYYRIPWPIPSSYNKSPSQATYSQFSP